MTTHESGTCRENHNSESLTVFKGPNVTITGRGVPVVNGTDTPGGAVAGGMAGVVSVAVMIPGETADVGPVQPDEYTIVRRRMPQRKG
jgi:hypothetical protein